MVMAAYLAARLTYVNVGNVVCFTVSSSTRQYVYAQAVTAAVFSGVSFLCVLVMMAVGLSSVDDNKTEATPAMVEHPNWLVVLKKPQRLCVRKDHTCEGKMNKSWRIFKYARCLMLNDNASIERVESAHIEERLPTYQQSERDSRDIETLRREEFGIEDNVIRTRSQRITDFIKAKYIYAVVFVLIGSAIGVLLILRLTHSRRTNEDITKQNGTWQRIHQQSADNDMNWLSRLINIFKWPEL